MKYYRYSMNMKTLNIFSLVLFVPFYILICFLGYSSYVDFKCLIIYFLWMILHEFLHGVGFSFSNVSHKSIVYGANLEKGIFYCMCKDSISKIGIMISLMFPFLFIGVFTLIFGFVFNAPVLIILSLFNIAGCAGDLAMFYSFIRLPNFTYTDLDDCTGFVLVSDNDLSSYKLFGMNLVESGDYSNLSRANDFKKFTISKLSSIIFGILLLFLLISFLV